MAKRAIAASSRVQPITIGAFTLDSKGMTVSGRPSFDEYQGVGDFITRATKASGFWMADWLRYGESRADWAGRLSQAQDASGLSLGTLKNIRSVGAIPLSRRRDGVEFALHAAVAGLDGDEQSAWLERAESEGWTLRELRLELKAARRTVIAGRAETMWTVDVTVRLSVEAVEAWQAEEAAAAQVKAAAAGLHAHVIGAHAYGEKARTA